MGNPTDGDARDPDYERRKLILRRALALLPRLGCHPPRVVPDHAIEVAHETDSAYLQAVYVDKRAMVDPDAYLQGILLNKIRDHIRKSHWHQYESETLDLSTVQVASSSVDDIEFLRATMDFQEKVAQLSSKRPKLVKLLRALMDGAEIRQAAASLDVPLSSAYRWIKELRRCLRD
jgi:DNA-directed RNA polymerase specialized sigma24 family protein